MVRRCVIYVILGYVLTKVLISPVASPRLNGDLPMKISELAEGVGFEPTVLFGTFF